MKKRFLIVAAAVTMTLFAITAAFAAELPRMNFATGGTTGIYYTLGGVIAQKLKEKGVLDMTVQSTGASNENLRLVNAGEVPIAFSQNDLAYAAYNGLEPYKSKHENLTAVVSTHSEVIHAVARAGIGLSKLEDFKGRKVSLGARGSGNEANCRQIFPFFGLTYDNISPIFLPYGESADQFKDRQIDAFLFTFAYPHPVIMDITTTHQVTYLPIGGKQADDIIAKFPYFIKTAIPANTYKGQDAAVPTLGVKAMLVANKNVPEALVYTFTKGVFDHLESIQAGHSKAAEMSLKTALEGLTVPLHPGAVKYYKEKGLIK
ncbi:MAG: TAXI family TRAP transporter solute-binding subunit [Deltaproteobacteria bacterium]|jgi:TRAP transporter TAXI family solute receptor|nr:TAXI family TRAP transporter solute-binding subunit [Deltaproteobacteria bacterium]